MSQLLVKNIVSFLLQRWMEIVSAETQSWTAVSGLAASTCRNESQLITHNLKVIWQVFDFVHCSSVVWDKCFFLFRILRLSSHSFIVQRWNQYSAFLLIRTHQDHRVGINPLQLPHPLLEGTSSACSYYLVMRLESFLIVPKTAFNIILIWCEKYYAKCLVVARCILDMHVFLFCSLCVQLVPVIDLNPAAHVWCSVSVAQKYCWLLCCREECATNH